MDRQSFTPTVDGREADCAGFVHLLAIGGAFGGRSIEGDICAGGAEQVGG